MSFADRLRQLRQEKGLSREQLAGLAGLGKGTVRDYEQGLREPTLRSAFALADALGVSVDSFRDEKQQKPKKAPTARQDATSGSKASKDTPEGKRAPRGKRKGKGE